MPFTNTKDSPCVVKFPCSWDSRKKGGYSWRTNRRQNATQLFWFLNKYHQHLKAAPIGFTQAAGNFEVFNASGHGFGGDPVLGQALDGANTLDLGNGLIGLPDFDHSDNANMSTPPDGFAPTMQMYLWNDPLTNIIAGPGSDPYIQSNGADEADIVFHEYTHGLSNRLVVDANGVSTLGNIQAGAMGEAWSDWYAMDYLVNRGLFTDTAAPGQLRVGQYVGAGQDLIRTEPMDCPVGSTSPQMPRHHRDRRLHVRRLREGHRSGRGPRGRRDLGPDALGPPSGARFEGDRGARDAGDGAVAVEPVVPG